MRWSLSFEIEIECDQRPIAMVATTKRVFYDGANALKEILLQGWLVPGNRSAMRNDRPRTSSAWIGVPERILLDGERRSCRESAVNPVPPPFKIRVAVV